MKEKAYCPECKKELELLAACGAANYFCNHCKKLVSSKNILTEQEASEENQES